MIHMPHRSVTRFFVPLIDVLLLLFCIFLLMPFASDDESEKKLEEAGKIKEDIIAISSEMERQNSDQASFEEARIAMKDVAEFQRMKEQLDKLKKQVSENPQQRYNFFIIDIERKDGKLSYVDSSGMRRQIKDAQDAKNLIASNKKDVSGNPKLKGKSLYYFFLYPRPQGGYPVGKQVREYKEWFADVDHSLP